MQICTLTQTHNHASIPPLSFFTGQMPFLLPNQQHQSTEGKLKHSECWQYIHTVELTKMVAKSGWQTSQLVNYLIQLQQSQQ